MKSSLFTQSKKQSKRFKDLKKKKKINLILKSKLLKNALDQSNQLSSQQLIHL